MTSPLITTKLGIPSLRPVLVPRQRLIQRLNEGIQGKLTLISAPAGYGKTTLAVEWLRETQRAVIWLSLEEADNDPARFLSYFMEGLQEIDERIGKETRRLLQVPQLPSQELLATTLLNELTAIDSGFILVIDDYHVIQTLSIHQLINFILEHQPGQMHIVLLTREDPPLPLPRLRVGGQMTEVRQDDLRFTDFETGEFLEDVMGLKISKSDIAALERHTEGWIAGLQLAALSLRVSPDAHAFVQSFTGSNRYVLDYLFEEVFQQQPPEVQNFLLTTSVLDKLTASLCNALSGRNDGQAQLEALEKVNLFIVPLDPSRRWYRYHRLFADLLRHQLRKTGEISETKLHQGASHWYWENHFPAEAVTHAMQAKDWELAAYQVWSSSDEILKRGEAATLVSWCAKLPEETLASHLGLSLNYAWALMLTSQFNAARSILDQVDQHARDEPAISGEIAAARAYLAQSLGDIPRMVELSQQALASLPPENLNGRSLVALNLGIAYWHIGRLDEAQRALDEALPACRQTGNTYGEIMASLFIARTLAVRGHLRRAGVMLEELAQAHGDIPANPLVHLDLGILYYEWNDLERADRHLQQALESSRTGGNTEFEVGAYLLLARLHLAQGDLAGVIRELEQARHLERSSPLPLRTHNRRLDLQAFIALWEGDLEAAGKLVSELSPDIDAHPFYRFLGLTSVRYALACGDKVGAAHTLDSAIQRARENDWSYGLIAAMALKALAEPTPKQALETLSAVLDLAQPHGFIRTFVEAGPQLVPLLQQAAQHGVSPGYVGEILSAFPAKTTPKRKMVVSGDLILEPLSEREMEVLRLMAAGLSNRQIARKLVLSLGTVKTHLHNIYGKLEARNRPQAVDRARELELL